MNNDQIALYLNDHPEFFNQYPELLARIQSIAPEDIPLKPVKTLNIADRILKRAQADTENMKNQLVSFMEISLAIRYGVTAGELAKSFHPYLTLGEAVKLAAISFGKSVEKLSCCAA